MKTRTSLLLVALALAAAPAAAQVRTAPAVEVKQPKPKIEKFRGEVIHFDAARIIVRSRENAMRVRTFTFADALKPKMEKLLTKGGYQYGDKVEIYYRAGSDTATRVKGKPSKPR